MSKGSIANLALAVGQRSAAERLEGGPEDDITILEYIDAPWGLGATEDGHKFKLFPVQRFILKVYYGLPLEAVEKIIPLSDWRRAHVEWVTEIEYFEHLFREGRINIDPKNYVEGEEKQELVLSCGRRSGKCISTKDSYVLTDRGILRMGDFVTDLDPEETKPFKIGVSQETPNKVVNTSHVYNGGSKPVFQVTTRSGYYISGTGNHRIRVMSENGTIQWRYLDDIREKDQIAIHRNTDLWASDYVDLKEFHNSRGYKKLDFPEKLTEDWGYLLGCLAGDGVWATEKQVTMVTGEDAMLNSMVDVFQTLFGEVKVKKDLRNTTVNYVSFFSVGMRKFLHDSGWIHNVETRKFPGEPKKIPWSIMRSPKSVIKAFLQGLFDTDGGVEKSGGVVSFSTASEVLSREVQLVLLNFGIVASRKEKIIKDRSYYTVTVRGFRSRKKFAEVIGFRLERKQRPLLDSVKVNFECKSDAESVPHQNSMYRKMYHSLENRTVFRSKFGNSVKLNNPEKLTYNRIKKLLHLIGETPYSNHFESLCELDYFYDPVKTINLSEEEVADWVVPETHHFVANGIINHNTLISSIIASFETFRLLSKGDPHRYFGLPSSNPIQLISVATDKDQAGLLYQEVSGHYRSSKFFRPFVANNTMTYARFQTLKDIEKYGSYQEDKGAKASVKVTFKSCVAKGLRGAGNIVIILDEVAHFTNDGQTSAESVWKAVRPSASAFSPKDPSTGMPTGPVESKIILISSPLGKNGLFYNRFQLGMRGGVAARKMLCIQAPTWEVNPTVEPEEFETNYASDPNTFFVEYGADFTDKNRTWIVQDEDLYNCVDISLRKQMAAPTRRAHFVGVDFALSGDATAIAIGHLEGDIIVLDFVGQLKAGVGKHVDQTRLDYDDVANWILGLSRKFYMSEGMFDQWSGIVFEQVLKKKGLAQIKMINLTKNISSQMYLAFKNLMLEKKLKLYDPGGETDGCERTYLEEILTLQEHFHSKYVVTVEAPSGVGYHDDRSDALVRMVWLASQQLGNGFHVSDGRGRTGMHRVPKHRGYHHMKKKAMRSGSVPERMVRRKKRW